MGKKASTISYFDIVDISCEFELLNFGGFKSVSYNEIELLVWVSVRGYPSFGDS